MDILGNFLVILGCCCCPLKKKSLPLLRTDCVVDRVCENARVLACLCWEFVKLNQKDFSLGWWLSNDLALFVECLRFILRSLLPVFGVWAPLVRYCCCWPLTLVLMDNVINDQLPYSETCPPFLVQCWHSISRWHLTAVLVLCRSDSIQWLIIFVGVCLQSLKLHGFHLTPLVAPGFMWWLLCELH